MVQRRNHHQNTGGTGSGKPHRKRCHEQILLIATDLAKVTSGKSTEKSITAAGGASTPRYPWLYELHFHACFNSGWTAGAVMMRALRTRYWVRGLLVSNSRKYWWDEYSRPDRQGGGRILGVAEEESENGAKTCGVRQHVTTLMRGCGAVISQDAAIRASPSR